MKIEDFVFTTKFQTQICAKELESIYEQKVGTCIVGKKGVVAYRGSGYLDVWGFCIEDEDLLYPLQYPSGAAIGCYLRVYGEEWIITDLGESFQELRKETGILTFSIFQTQILNNLIKKYRCERRGDVLFFPIVTHLSLPKKISLLLGCLYEIGNLVNNPRFRKKMKKDKACKIVKAMSS